MNSSTTTPQESQSCIVHGLTEKVVKTLAFSVVALVSLLGNSLICFILYKRKELRRTINYFIFNMAVSDLLVPIFTIPRRIKEFFVAVPARWLISGSFGAFLCPFSYFAQDVSFLVSVLSLVFMAFERFLAIVFPMKANAIITSRSRAALIALTWIIAVATHGHYFYTFRLEKTDHNETLCITTWEPALDDWSTKRTFSITTFALFVITPLILLVTFYTSIAISIRRQNKRLMHGTDEISDRIRRVRENRAVTILSAAVVSGFVLCCAPMNVYVFYRVFAFDSLEEPTCDHLKFFFVANFLVRASTMVNPCTCFAFYRSYRRTLCDLIRSFFRVLSKPCNTNQPTDSPPPEHLELRGIIGAKPERRTTVEIHRL